MRIIIKLFGPGKQEPTIVIEGQLLQTINTEDLPLLWDLEQTFNNHARGRCHIDLIEDPA